MISVRSSSAAYSVRNSAPRLSAPSERKSCGCSDMWTYTFSLLVANINSAYGGCDSGDRKQLFGGATLLRLGGHFPGSAVLHWAPGADRRGILCTGVRPSLVHACIACVAPGSLVADMCRHGTFLP